MKHLAFFFVSLLLISCLAFFVPEAYATSTYLACNSFSGDHLEWGEVGSSPYLGAIDYSTNYISLARLKEGLIEGHFGFEDSALTETIDNVYLELYAQRVGTTVLTATIYDGSSWTTGHSFTIGTSWGWYSHTITAEIGTWAKINSFLMELVGTTGIVVGDLLRVDAARLIVVSHAVVATTLTKYGTATLTFQAKGTKTVGFSRAGTSTFTFAVASETVSGRFHSFEGAASLTFVTGTLLEWAFSREGLADLMFGKPLTERIWSFPVEGSSALAFVVDSTYGSFRLFYEEGSAGLAFLVNGLKAVEANFFGSSVLTFSENFQKAITFSRQGSSILTFLAESTAKLVSAQILSLYGEAILTFLSEGTHLISRLFLFEGYAPLSFNVESMTSMPTTHLNAAILFMGMSIIAILIIAITLFIMRGRRT